MRPPRVTALACATRARLAFALLLTLSGAAHADEPLDSPELVIVPIECAQYWTIPGGPSSPIAWDTVLSFAACIQDASVFRIEHEEELTAFVQQLQGALHPSLQLYAEVIEHAPDRLKLKAVYFVGLGQVALMTRARRSIVSTTLRAPLEALLEPHAKVAYRFFTAIDQAVTNDPGLASDVVSRYMVRSAREHAASLRTRWRSPP